MDTAMATVPGMPTRRRPRRDREADRWSAAARSRHAGFAMLVPATAAFFAMSANAQVATDATVAARRGWVIVPRVSVSETFTDNATLGSAARQSDLVTEISPGVSVQSNSGRLKGSFDYSLRNFLYAQGSQGNRSQNSLNTFGSLEAVEKWLYVDFSGLVSRQTISAFGTQVASDTSTNANSTETATFRLSPYVRGRLGSFADYNVRYSHSETSSKSALATNVATDDFSASLSGLTRLSRISWGLDASRQSVGYGSSRKNESDRLNGQLFYLYSPELKFTTRYGVEANNYSTLTKEPRSSFGYGADWSPSERTQLSVFRERRFFGDGHTITFNHRLPRSVVRFTDTRDVSVLPNQLTSVGLGTYYDLLFSQLQSAIPDPVLRAQQVNALLQQSGIAPNSTVTANFLTSRASVRRRQELSLVLNGLRNTVTYTFFQSTAESVSAAAVPLPDDFSASGVVKQRGMSSNYSHRLTALTSINSLGSWTRNSGSTAGLENTMKLLNVNVSTKLSPKTSASFGIRTTVSSGATSYRENAVLGALHATF